MTAEAVLEQIKALPPEEKAEVVEFLEGIKSIEQVKTMEPETFGNSAKHGFDRHAELMTKLSQ